MTIVARIVGQDTRFASDVRLQNRSHGFDFEIIDDHAARLLGSAVNQGKHFVLVLEAAPFLLASWLLAKVATNEGFIDLDGVPVLAERRQIAGAHRFANAVAHEPCAF